MHKSYLKDMSYERVLSSVDNKGAKSIVSADTQKAQKPVNISTMFQTRVTLNWLSYPSNTFSPT